MNRVTKRWKSRPRKFLHTVKDKPIWREYQDPLFFVGEALLIHRDKEALYDDKLTQKKKNVILVCFQRSSRNNLFKSLRLQKNSSIRKHQTMGGKKITTMVRKVSIKTWRGTSIISSTHSNLINNSPFTGQVHKSHRIASDIRRQPRKQDQRLTHVDEPTPKLYLIPFLSLQNPRNSIPRASNASESQSKWNRRIFEGTKNLRRGKSTKIRIVPFLT